MNEVEVGWQWERDLVVCSRRKKRTIQKGVGGGDALVEDE